MVKYSDGQHCNSRCSIKLDTSGDYLYLSKTKKLEIKIFHFFFLVAKDGHIRVFNTITTKLIKTILSPEKKEPNQLYSEIPSIHIFDDLSMLYGINHKLMHYSI